MSLQNILTPGHAIRAVPGFSQKRTLEDIANFFGQKSPNVSANELFNLLVAREKLSSTGLGRGLAIPHCRMTECVHPKALFLRLADPVDFDAIDNQPVDLVFALVVPQDDTEQYLDILQQIANRLSNDTLYQQLRTAQDNESLYRLVTTDTSPTLEDRNSC